MRQKDDQNFARALNFLANCCLTENYIGLFTSTGRIIGKDSKAMLLNRWGMALLRKYSVKVINWGLIH